MTTCNGDFGCEFCRGNSEERPAELVGHCLHATHFTPTGGYALCTIHRLEDLSNKLDTLIDLTQQLVDAQT